MKIAMLADNGQEGNIYIYAEGRKYFLDVIECYQWKFKLSLRKRPDW